MSIKKSLIANSAFQIDPSNVSYRYMGDARSNEIHGGGGDDRLLGRYGDDNLSGGLGRDILKGGKGYDSFVFDSAIGGNNIDYIADINTKIGEKIFLEKDIFQTIKTRPSDEVEGDYTGRGVMAKSAFFVGSAAHDADDRIIYNKQTGAISYDADGNGAGAAIQFAQVEAGTKLKASDFFMM
jgi:serralysin